MIPLVQRYSSLYVRPYIWYVHHKVDVRCTDLDTLPSPPFLLLPTHGSYIDPYLLMPRIRDVCWVINRDLFSSPIGWVIAVTMRFVLKQKGRPSLHAVERIEQLISRGEVVGMFPEGDRSWDGRTGPIRPATAKIVARLGVPVVFARITGSYCCLPRWSSRLRPGKVAIEFTTLPIEQVRALSVTELHERILAELAHDDIAACRQRGMVVKGASPTQGIQHLLWLCPRCRAMDSIKGDGALIWCTACNSEWRLDSHMGIAPTIDTIENLADWNAFQSAHAAYLCRTADDETILARTPAVSMRGPGHGWRRGTIRLYSRTFRFEPRTGAPCELPTHRMRYVVDNFNKYLKFNVGLDEYRIRFHGRNSLKYIQLLDHLHALS